MEFSLNPIKKEEQKYSFSQSSQISGQTGLIGHLTAKLVADVNGFLSYWTDFRRDLDTPEFEAEFGKVLNSLCFDKKYMRFLKNKTYLMNYCHSTPESSFGPDSDYYGFRANTENYAYIFRITPNNDEETLYCYCYKKDWLDNHIQKAEKGIRFINSHYKELFRIADGDMIRVQSPNMSSRDEKCRYIDDYHLEVGNNLFHICEFAERMEANGNTVIPLRSTLPEMMYIYAESEDVIAIVNKGETGYSPTDIGEGLSPDEKTALTEKLNGKLDITQMQRYAMKAGSMFGFDKPVADPKNYTDTGNLIKNHKDKGEAR